MRGLELKNIRKNMGLSQTEFAEKLNISLRTLFSWEKDNRLISDKYIIKIENIKNQFKNDFLLVKYEYEVITFDNFDAGHQQRYINERSQQGWELVSVIHFTDTDGTPCFRFYFKRKV